MNTKAFTLIIVLLLVTFFPGQAQMLKRPTKKVYVSTGFDMFVLSTSILEKPGSDTKLTPPRFTFLPFLGLNLNFDFSRNIGLYTGLDIKNFGFIEKFHNPDSTVKRRVYTVGVPLGLKIGEIKYGSYVILGIGADFPIHYKEKGFTDRGNKTKYNEWFSDRTPRIMPYAFVGIHFRPAFALKLQYYPSNFLNTKYMANTIAAKPEYPYSGYSVSTIMLTAGIDIPFSPKD